MNSFTHDWDDNGTANSEPVVRYGRDEHGNVSIFVREEYRPVLLVLLDHPTWGWPRVLAHAKLPQREWVIGGNAYDIIIDSIGVSIVDQLEDTTLAVLPHQDFITIVEGYLAELDAWYAARGLTDQRIDLHHVELNPEGEPHHQE